MAPKRQQSMPRLELCAALTGAQLSSLLHKELTLCIAQTFLWTDCTTVLTWLTSQLCRFKVFVGTRVSEIQELTASHTWRDQHSFAVHRMNGHPVLASQSQRTVTSSPPKIPDLTRFSSWRELVKATQQSLHGAAADPASPLCDLRDAEVHLLKTSQTDCFSEEIRCLRTGKPVPPSSRLSTLAPELDPTLGLIRVGGRLRRLDSSSPTDIHPILMDPRHAVTTLLIKEMDAQLHRPGPDRAGVGNSFSPGAA
ncbi:uncharacterized protein LOC133663012 [Entelurus aequoreus]|uniref:uncharacterized protein LOC133663012 n=1 Tax=Entelurus aequoreus TaxID=161455 RepID=UPI002B1E238C|nr:uncharacterized protein LOC133663012 [Entelurus aequoreus]